MGIVLSVDNLYVISPSLRGFSPVSYKLAPHEETAFAILASILIERGQVERDALRVLVASKGRAVGREYMRLRELGLIEEFSIRQNFLHRLFGTKPILQVRMTDTGRELASPTNGGILKSEPMVTPAQVANPDLQEIAVDKKSGPYELDALRYEEVHPMGREIVPEICSKAVAVAPDNLGDVKARIPPPKRFAATDYTDVIGGKAEDANLALARSERLDGLTELLALLGFELTPAGNLLAANRWADGQIDADVALEVLVTSVAHAARLDQTGTARLDQCAILYCLKSVEETMSNFVSEGHLTSAKLSESMQVMRGFIQGDDRSLDAINDLLSDPLRGMAPPAILPEEVWVASEVEDK